MDVRRLVQVVIARIWFVLGVTLLLLAIFLLAPQLNKSQVYVSTAKVLLTPSSSNLSDSESRYSETSGGWMTDQQTLQELLMSERLLTRVAQINPKKLAWQELRDAQRFEVVSLDPERRVNMFALSFQDESPDQSLKLTEVAVAEFIKYVEELSAREYGNSKRFLEELVAEAKEKVDDTEEQILKLSTKRPNHSQSEAIEATLGAIDADKSKIREEIAVLEADNDSVNDFLSGRTSVLASSLTQNGGETSLGQMESALAAATFKQLELEQLFTNENQELIDQRAKVAKMKDVYQARARDLASSIGKDKSNRLNERRKQLAALEERASKIRNEQLSPIDKRRVEKLGRELTMWEDNHLSLVKQLYRARVVEQNSKRQGAITVLETPSKGVLARDKKTRGLAAQIAIYLPFSFGVAVSLAVAMDLLSSSFRLVPKIESALETVVMAVIPSLEPEMGQVWESYKHESTAPRLSLPLLRGAPEQPSESEV